MGTIKVLYKPLRFCDYLLLSIIIVVVDEYREVILWQDEELGAKTEEPDDTRMGPVWIGEGSTQTERQHEQ